MSIKQNITKAPLLLLNLVMMALMICCQKSDLINDQVVVTELRETSLRELPEDIINALQLMKDQGYDESELLEIRGILIDCSGDPQCLMEMLTSDQSNDFRSAIRIVSLPEIILDIDDQSVWTAKYDVEKAFVVLSHSSRDVQVAIDFDDPFDDQKSIGFSARIDGIEYAVQDFAREANLVQSDQDGGKVEQVKVSLNGAEIIYQSAGGTYGKMGKNEDPETVKMTANISIENNYLQVDLQGLYYIFTPKDDIDLTFRSRNELKEVHIELDDVFRVYQENVDRVRVRNAYPYPITIHTEVKRIQFDAVEGAQRFEIDFDHTYKDRGQKYVHSTLRIEQLVK